MLNTHIIMYFIFACMLLLYVTQIGVLYFIVALICSCHAHELCKEHLVYDSVRFCILCPPKPWWLSTTNVWRPTIMQLLSLWLSSTTNWQTKHQVYRINTTTTTEHR